MNNQDGLADGVVQPRGGITRTSAGRDRGRTNPRPFGQKKEFIKAVTSA
jgi:hypothetical protein